VRRLLVLTLPLLFAAAACPAPADTGADADPNAPDADPLAPDARPGTPDSRPGTPDASTISSMVTVIVEPNGNGGAELVSAINGATSSVYMTMYELDDSKVLTALVGRKQAGKDVQVILDGSSTTKSWNTPAYDQLSTAGVNVVWSSTASFTYTHEKTVIVDGAVAWIMTMNSNTSSPKDNREYLAIDKDPDDVAEATAIFVADHAHTPVSPSGALVVANNNARPRLVALIDSATTTLDLEDEEFSDSYSTGITAAVVRAAKRGVAVRVTIANQTLESGTTTAISQVKAAGGKVVMTGPTSGNGTPSNPYIHAKAITVDCAGTTCARGWVGSENMTAGSLGYNRELGVEIADQTQLAKVQAAIAIDYANGKAQ
jgi:phosphatidylserine/phosphatidylglycerophosphate/cardiolipin synthase-like enzyme